MPTAYLSALGMMGRRHLKGLARAGFSVFSCDPDPAAHAAARSELAQSGLSEDCLRSDAALPEAIDVAIFSETRFGVRSSGSCGSNIRLFFLRLYPRISSRYSAFGIRVIRIGFATDPTIREKNMSVA